MHVGFGPLSDVTLVMVDELEDGAEAVRDAVTEAGPVVADEAEPEEDTRLSELWMAANLAETTELIDAIFALSSFTVKESACPSVCTGGKARDTEEL